MDAVALLRRAQEVGLRVEPIGDKLLVRGPKRAEAVVKLLAEHKAEVLAALALGAATSERGDRESAVNFNEARRWRDRLAIRIGEWFRGDRGWEEARWLAWGDLENEWHELHGRRWPSWQCAGCNAPLSGSQVLNLPDGNRVHFEPIDCLIRFGKRWRRDASDALIAFGLEPPGLGGDQLVAIEGIDANHAVALLAEGGERLACRVCGGTDGNFQRVTYVGAPSGGVPVHPDCVAAFFEQLDGCKLDLIAGDRA